jgi:hypothetical protein
MANIISALYVLDNELSKKQLLSFAQTGLSRFSKLGSIPIMELILDE